MEPGEYRAEVTHVVQEESSTGNQMLTWTFKLHEGTFCNRTIRFWTSLAPQALWKLKATLEAFEIEVDRVVDLDLKELVGLSCTLVIEDNLYEGKTVSKVAEVLPADSDEEPPEEDNVPDAAPAVSFDTMKSFIATEDDDEDEEAAPTTTPKRKTAKLEP